MHGEFIAVWNETYREIWNPLLQQEGVPDDVYSALYRELYEAIGVENSDDPYTLLLNDAIQLRQAFEYAVILASVTIDLDIVNNVYEASGVTTLTNPLKRKESVESALVSIIRDASKAAQLLNQSLTEFINDPVKRAEVKSRSLDEILNDTGKSKKAFEEVKSSSLINERVVINFIEVTFVILEDYGNENLSNNYFNLLKEFIIKFSLRYDIRRPCILCPTLPGLFASLVRDLRSITTKNTHLNALMNEFDSSIQDLRTGCTDGRIKTCIQKQVNLLEAIGQQFPGVTSNTLGAICNQVGTWPHDKLKEAMKNLYGFASDYPGIRHGGSPANALRVIEMRDMISMSILLIGFTPYLSNQLNADVVYYGLIE